MRPRLTNEEAIALYRKVHGDLYDYSKTVYNGNCQKIVVTCRVHGDFSVQHNNHAFGGNGCGVCGKEKAGRPQDEREVCEKHGEYKVKVGCGRCKQAEAHERHAEAFIANAQKIHGDLYDYSNTVYVTTHAKVSVTCKACKGTFSVSPSNHLRHKVGCQLCHRGRGGFNKTKAGTLYLLEADGVFKVGITNTTAAARCKFISGRAGVNFKVTRSVVFENGEECVEAERQVLEMIREFSLIQTDLRFDGRNECFVAPAVPDYVHNHFDNAENLTRSTT